MYVYVYIYVNMYVYVYTNLYVYMSTNAKRTSYRSARSPALYHRIGSRYWSKNGRSSTKARGGVRSK